MYKNIKHGITFHGQSAIFKLRFAEDRPNFIAEMQKHCHWIDAWQTQYKGKTYFYIAGSFHTSINNIFNKSLLRAKATKMIDAGWELLEQANAL
jgi:hypothetical protein